MTSVDFMMATTASPTLISRSWTASLVIMAVIMSGASIFYFNIGHHCSSFYSFHFSFEHIPCTHFHLTSPHHRYAYILFNLQYKYLMQNLQFEVPLTVIDHEFSKIRTNWNYTFPTKISMECPSNPLVPRS